MLSCQWPITFISSDRVVARISIKLGVQHRLVTLWEGDMSHLKYTSDVLQDITNVNAPLDCLDEDENLSL